MTVTQVQKRVRCPKCQALIRTRYATDGTWILQDGKPSLLPPSEQEGKDDFEEAVKKIVDERLREHEESSYHA